MTSHTGKAGVIVAPDDVGSMDKLAHAVLDDLMYNIVHDLLLKVHRDEKMARATTAAIRVEKLASDASETSTPESKPDVRIETDAAIYEDGKVLLKGNPLKTTSEILCPRCHLPRLLYPTDGKGAKKPDPSVIYCKKHPYIDKPGFDIYGQTWVQPGPGRGKKKKDMKPDPNIESGPGESRPPNVLSFPSATCSKCKRCILVTRLNNHMGSCIGMSGRNASRAAAAKISNGSNGASQNDGTPPSSQKATPAPASRASSPKKRDSEEVAAPEEEDESADSHKKKKLKSTPLMTKKVILKTKGPKKEKVKSSSLLSREAKPDDGDNSTVEVAPKKERKEAKGISPAKKLKLGAAKPPLSSTLSKNGRNEDAESESSGTLSEPHPAPSSTSPSSSAGASPKQYGLDASKKQLTSTKTERRVHQPSARGKFSPKEPCLKGQTVAKATVATTGTSATKGPSAIKNQASVKGQPVAEAQPATKTRKRPSNQNESHANKRRCS
ncbi:transcriptional activator [Colletotrichum tofieldiae]|nr:transcriptional activator [Colletotrichum tofieldiae]GKT69243.1 transcriptional activator [Colletotrichum tofieldiae]